MAEIGSIGVEPVHSVSSNGGVEPLGSGCLVHWGVRADDRWHIARDEQAVRQIVAEDGVTIETRLRVPGGDIVHRASSTPYRNTSLVIVEIENETPLPVAIALFTVGAGIWRCEGNMLFRNSVSVISASKPVSHCLIAASEDDMMNDLKLEESQNDAKRSKSVKGSHVATVFPLPHTSSLRLVFCVENKLDSLPTPDDLPNLEGIANGWNAHLDYGSTVVLEDERVQKVLFAARRHLLVGCEQALTSSYWLKGVPAYAPTLAISSMCLWGHIEAARHLLTQSIDRYQVSSFQRPKMEYLAYLLWACNEFTLHQMNDEATVPILNWAIEQIGNFVNAIPRSRIRSRVGHSYLRLGLESSVSILNRSGRIEEAEQLEDALPKIYRTNSMSSQPEILPNALLDQGESAMPLAKYLNDYLGASEGSDSLSEIIGRAEPTGGFSSAERLQDPFASALFLLMFRRSLVSQPDSSTIALFPSYTSKWFNVPVEVSSMPTSNGEVGYAVRWHGDRPALLWEGKINSKTTFTSPGFDPAWQSNEARGEALLPQQKPDEIAIPLISSPVQKPANTPSKTERGDNFS